MSNPSKPKETNNYLLASLKESDPCIKEILGQAGRCALYRYVQRKFFLMDVSGPVYFIKRTKEPFYQLMIVNTKHKNEDSNFLLNLNEIEEYETIDNYLYLNHSQIHVLWYPEMDELKACISYIKQYSKAVFIKSDSTTL
ncbi:hypothetical protein WA158_001054 [Blastocystis sp. Blastoise]